MAADGEHGCYSPAMSELQAVLLAAKRGLAPWEPIPETRWREVASRCGPAEIAEIGERIARLVSDLAQVEHWDGDTRDDIHRAIEMFRAIVELAASTG